MSAPALVTTPAGVDALRRSLEGAAVIAVDVEGDGLHAYRARLCTAQFAWHAGGEEATSLAVVDALATPLAPLAEALSAAGPPKVLHDLTLDARLLASHGVTLGNVRDTSVAARLLGHKQLGLAALAASLLGVRLDKSQQQHDWGARPLSDAQLAYLADDVRHLASVERTLAAEVARTGVADEVDEEVRYKLAEAFRQPTPAAPYLRLKGFDRLEPVAQAVARRATFAREALAEARNVPPFKVASNEFLLLLATRRPDDPTGVRALRDAAGSRAAEVWAAAVREGLSDGALPPAEAAALVHPPFDRAEAQLRRTCEERLRAWRRREALDRGVDEQAVLPGHCLTALVSSRPTAPGALAAVPGLGATRAARYGDALLALLSEDATR